MRLGEINDLRHLAVRRLASGVAVVSVWHGDVAQGATVSSVTAVSKCPLLIALCLRTGSRMAAVIGEAGRFAVNVLSTRQGLLAGWFADPSRPHGLAQFDHLEWEPDPFSGAPWIGGSLASLGCRLTDVVRAGDHDMLLAEVTTARAGDGMPLLHYTGHLHDGMLRLLSREATHPAARRSVTSMTPSTAWRRTSG